MESRSSLTKSALIKTVVAILLLLVFLFFLRFTVVFYQRYTTDPDDVTVRLNWLNHAYNEGQYADLRDRVTYDTGSHNYGGEDYDRALEMLAAYEQYMDVLEYTREAALFGDVSFLTRAADSRRALERMAGNCIFPENERRVAQLIKALGEGD